ncbi:MAG: class II fumarate hydratase [Deferribacterota bacterium]|nr:class II fumarate hydratase [Deferribacterota bacterium]
MTYRTEKDSLGELKIEIDKYYGVQTARALKNFNISGMALPIDFIRAVTLIKMAAATANTKLGLLENKLGDAIINAASEILEGKYDDQFPIDIYQTGSGTSTNMNVNEVIANRTCELLGGNKGDKTICHPNDHVNMGQSSNDVIPSAIHISAVLKTKGLLIPQLEKLQKVLEDKAEEFSDVIKIGRTHLMDATPTTLGNEFSSYAKQIELSINRIDQSLEGLYELPLGGTAIGTGINTDKQFGELTIKEISSLTNISFVQSDNLFEGLASKDAVVFFSGSLNTLACAIMKIANDLRLLNSGPRCGISEITLPALQPGSSIMPGKVNPVIPESAIQVAATVMGMHQTISIAGSSGNLELNVMMPLIAYNILFMIEILANIASHLNYKCIKGIVANREKCLNYVEWSMALVTPLAKKIGYDKAAEIAHEAFEKNKTVKEIVAQKGILSTEELEDILNPWNMI